jgi:hypothetical protein
MVMTYIPSDALWHKEQEYVQLKGGEFNGFQDIKMFLIVPPTRPQGTMTLTNLRFYYVWNLLCTFEVFGSIGS